MQSSLGGVIREVVRTLALDTPGVADAELLARYLAGRDGDAFAALVRRHGPMVLGVCRRVLARHHDAEDAFQATFLVLVRKAGSIQPKGMVGNWLYGVAYQTAVRARAVAASRRNREAHMADVPEPAVATQADDLSDVLPLLDRELHSLPDKYRAPIVLCDLQGKTRTEAAAELGWPPGTVAGRLARGRAMLAKRLLRRGVTLSVGSLGAALAGAAAACVPLPLVDATIRAADLFAAGSAAGVISSHVAALTEGVLKTMLLNKIKAGAAVLLVAASIGAGGWLIPSHAAQPPASAPADPPVAVKPKGPDLPAPGDPPTVTPPKPLTEPGPGPTVPSIDLPKPGDPLIPSIPGPPTPEQLRARYLQLQEELSRHMSALQVKQKVDELEREVAAARDKAQKAAREKQAADELEKVRASLGNIAKTFHDTEAGKRAQQALFYLSAPSSPTNTTNGTRLPPGAPPNEPCDSTIGSPK